MAAFLLAATIVTNAVLLVIGVRMWRLASGIRTRFARLQALVVVFLCLAGVVASIQDLGIHAIRLGWLTVDVGGPLVNVVQGLLVLGGLGTLVPTLFLLRKLTREFARSEAIADTFVDRLPAGVSIETAGLTRREIEVVELIGTGKLSDQEIATALVISPATAGTHVRNIMGKTGVKRRNDLALLVLAPPDRDHNP